MHSSHLDTPEMCLRNHEYNVAEHMTRKQLFCSEYFTISVTI